MHIHILGICGTFMGSLALLAKELGHRVTGSDINVYPPMSTQLEEQGIALMQGYSAEHLKPAPDLVVVGNALSRGNPAVEYMLDAGLPYVSGPQWLAEHVLQGRWVLAVAGTHGKRLPAVCWLDLRICRYAAGVFDWRCAAELWCLSSARRDRLFVVEADEYDSAFLISAPSVCTTVLVPLCSIT